MASGSAKIGALHVELSLNSAQFNTGINKAQGDLSRFGKLAANVATAVAAAGIAAGVALGHAVKAAANHADELSKSAQKIGVTVEALSRLEWAAKLSDVSLEQLTGGLGRLSRQMLEVATGSTGPAATAFAALGVAVTDAAGNLRSSDEVFADIADRFGRMEDGATKTALAIQIFGKAGAELIPLLNAGRDGLKEMADESDRLGQTISSETGKAAEEFNDNLTRLDAVLSGLANRVMAESIPALRDLTATMADPQVQNAIIGLTNLVLGLGNALAQAVGFAGQLVNVVPQIAAGEDKQVYAIPGQEDFITKHQTGGPGSSFKDKFGAALGAGGGGVGGGMPAMQPFVVDLDALVSSATKAKEVIDPLQARIAELNDVLATSHDPFTQMQTDLTDLKTIWEEGRISVEQYSAAVQATQMNAASSVLGMAGQISGALAGMFKDNKAFAIANAVINTAEGVTKALAQGGAFGFISAAAVAASGAAQIASIMSAQPGSASAPAAVAPPAADTSAGTAQAINISLSGSGRYSRDEVLGLLDQLASAAKDRGLDLNLVRA